MNCDEFLRRLDDEGLPLGGEAAAHAASCPACLRELERWQAAHSGLREMRAEEPPPFLHARIMATVRAAGEPRRRPAWVAWVRPTVLAPALVLILAAGIGSLLVWERTRPAELAPPPAATTAETQAAPPRDKGEASAPSSPRETELREQPPAPRQAPLQERRAARQRPQQQATPAAPGRNQPELMREEITVTGALTPIVSAPAPAGTPDENRGAFAEALDAEPAPAPEPLAKAAAPAAGALRDRRSETGKGETADHAMPASARLVRCTLLDSKGRPLAELALPSDQSPPPAGAWTIEIAGGGTVAIRDAGGAELAAPRTRDAVAALRLPPGRYRLTR